MALYEPEPLPEDFEDFKRAVEAELRRVATAIDLAWGTAPKAYSAPSKPRDGMIRYADGVSWNPGLGAGLYLYREGTGWEKL